MDEQSHDLPGTEPAQSVILVVDDNEVNCDLLTRRLARKGFATESACDGFRALEWLANKINTAVFIIFMHLALCIIAVLFLNKWLPKI